MTLAQLTYVVKIAETKSMNKAAAELFVSQPALSGAIRELEEEIHTSLFIRTNRGVLLTTQGEEFLRRAKELKIEKSKPKPLVHGKDLIELGLEPGPRFGQILGQVYTAQLDGEIENRDQALEMAKKLFR